MRAPPHVYNHTVKKRSLKRTGFLRQWKGMFLCTALSMKRDNDPASHFLSAFLCHISFLRAGRFYLQFMSCMLHWFAHCTITSQTDLRRIDVGVPSKKTKQKQNQKHKRLLYLNQSLSLSSVSGRWRVHPLRCSVIPGTKARSQVLYLRWTNPCSVELEGYNLSAAFRLVNRLLSSVHTNGNLTSI